MIKYKKQPLATQDYMYSIAGYNSLHNCKMDAWCFPFFFGGGTASPRALPLSKDILSTAKINYSK